jgi:YD repeat-containing protein
LAGVTVSILQHPEYGQTLTRADGMFDLAVDGGGLLTLNYQRDGFLPAQRSVEVPWQDFNVLPDVVLTQSDPVVTVVDLSQPGMKVARGSVSSDADGDRQATLLIPEGTQASVFLADGSTQPVDTLTLRLTEYTVGENGPEAMPAQLPPTSAYTYAVELKAEETVIKQAGKDVLFDRPVPFYLDNFLGMPTGIAVPLAYYDNEDAAWVPVDDGRVIEILSVSGGEAQLDSTGDGLADNGTSLGVSAEERTSLAGLYAAGQSLWRLALNHLSTHDPNDPVVREAGAQDPQPDPAHSGDAKKEGDGCKNPNASVIECQNQILGERIALTGSAFSLNYASDRVPGRKAAYELQIPLGGDEIPSVLNGIQVEFTLAGRMISERMPPTPNQTYRYQWDGLDAYGRALQGAQPVSVRVGYIYDGYYALPPNMARSFGATSGELIPGDIPARREVISWQTQRTSVGGWDGRASALGGWSLSPHHSYDPLGRVLYRGDGSRMQATVVGNSISTVAGGGSSLGDGGPATDARFYLPHTMAVAPDGSLYIADAGQHRVRRIDPDGIITTVAGTGSAGSSGDGGPATSAQLYSPIGVDLGPDGSLYIAEYYGHRIRRVTPDGIIQTVAGTGIAGFSGDGGPATSAQINHPQGIAVAHDGTLFIADMYNHRIRRVGPDGIIETMAGDGVQGFGGDGGPAIDARLNYPSRLMWAPDGSLYLTSGRNDRVRRIGPDGIIDTIAGTGVEGSSGDGGPATAAELAWPLGTALAPDGSLYIAEYHGHRIRRIGSDGIITTVAGTGVSGYSGDGGPARAAEINGPAGLAFDPAGKLYIAERDNNVIRKVEPPLPGFGYGELAVASEDGGLLYRFDEYGRHLQTLSTLTGAALYQFGYDTAGRLSSVTDGDGNTTSIERDADGVPTAIVAPFGQRTELSFRDCLETHTMQIS